MPQSPSQRTAIDDADALSSDHANTSALLAAEAEKQAAILRAEGEAKAATIRAEGDAMAMRTRKEAYDALKGPEDLDHDV